MSKKSKAGKRARVKGHNFEREVVNIFKPLFPNTVRILEYQSHNAKGIDVKAGPFLIQCKRSAKSVPMNKIKEVHLEKGKVPLLISRVDRESNMVTMALEDFLKILKAWALKEES